MPNHKNDKEQSIIPGMEDFVTHQTDEFFWEGQKKETYFDSAALPDAPGRQENAHGHTTYSLYVLFPDQESLLRAMEIFTLGLRKVLKANDKIAALNAVAVVPKDPHGRTFLEVWEDEFKLDGKPKKKKKVVDEDEAQAPI